MFSPSKPLRLEDIVIDSTLLQEINCYFISRNRNNTPDENIKTELRAITMNDLVKAVDRSLSASSSSLKTWIHPLHLITLLDGQSQIQLFGDDHSQNYCVVLMFFLTSQKVRYCSSCGVDKVKCSSSSRTTVQFYDSMLNCFVTFLY